MGPMNYVGGIMIALTTPRFTITGGWVWGGSDAAGDRLEESFPRCQKREFSDGTRTPREYLQTLDVR